MPRFVDDRDFEDDVPERVAVSDPREAVSGLRTEFFSDRYLLRAADLPSFARLDADAAPPGAREAERRVMPGGARFASVARSVDLRRFNPTQARRGWPSSLSGTAAQVRPSLASQWLPVFRSNALPCVDRRVRREVMFAKRKAGRGYRKPRRRSWSSWVRC